MNFDFERARKEIKDLYMSLAAIPAVSGSEELCAEKIKNTVMQYTDFFGECDILSSGGLIFTHRCGKENAKKLLFDAHLDTVGFCVTEILDGGFVRVSPVGGIDRRLLFASDVEIYGKKTVKGVFISNPPHLKKLEKNKDALPEMSQILIDTGLSDAHLEEYISVGDACGFTFSPTELLNDILCGRSMDDRICACAVLLAAKMLSDEECGCDIIFSFSSAEEVNGTGGAYLGKLEADAAIVLDVNFGRDKGIPDEVSYVLGSGCGVSYSCTTSHALTDALVGLAAAKEIPLCTLVEPKHTGTNAHFLSNAHLGTPCAVLSIPEKYMHQSCETVDMKDVFACARLLCEFAKAFPETAEEVTPRKIIKKLPCRGGEHNGL